ncbi:hypothetical protein IKA15_02890 [bacterium]|nr:hypothetical protein [bacterium]
MLPTIYEDTYLELTDEILKDISQWRKSMIHYIKDENPELNSAIIELANKTSLDPKALATGAYLAYKLLEIEANGESGSIIEE